MNKNKVFEIPDYDGAGIYAIVNIEDFGVYVGSSRNIRTRAMQHEKAMRDRKHTVADLNQDGANDFLILCKTEKDIENWKLRTLEWLYMLCFKERFKLYNQAPKDKSTNGFYRDITLNLIAGLNIRDEVENKILERYGNHSWDLRNRKPENRKCTKETITNVCDCV